MNRTTTLNHLALLLILIIPFKQHAQNSFLKTYPTTYDKDAREVLVMPDGGYLIAGSTNNSDLMDCDLYISKTDAQGNFVWGKIYGGIKPEYAYSMIETSDGNYFVLGYSMSFGGGDKDIYLIKIDPSGNLIWQKTYGGWGNEEGREIISTSDGNYAFVASSNSNFTSSQMTLTKIDLSGNVLWSKNYGGSMAEFGNSLKESNDGGFILTGKTLSFGSQPNGSAYLVKTNSVGDTTWTKYYDTGTMVSEGISLIAETDGTYLFAVRDSASASDVDIRLIKTNASGSILWNKIYGGIKKDTPKKLRKTSEGGYMIASTSRSFGWINPDMWILKLTNTGDTIWTKHYGGVNHEHGNDVKEIQGAYIAVGHARSYGPDGQRIMLVKIDNGGVSMLSSTNNDISFNLFPNPSADGNITFQSAKNTSSQLTVNNSIGQTILKETLVFESNESKTLKIGEDQPGIYLVTLKTGEAIFSKKIIVQ
jgi:hypothetical protein